MKRVKRLKYDNDLLKITDKQYNSFMIFLKKYKIDPKVETENDGFVILRHAMCFYTKMIIDNKAKKFRHELMRKCFLKKCATKDLY